MTVSRKKWPKICRFLRPLKSIRRSLRTVDHFQNLMNYALRICWTPCVCFILYINTNIYTNSACPHADFARRVQQALKRESLSNDRTCPPGIRRVTLSGNLALILMFVFPMSFMVQFKPPWNYIDAAIRHVCIVHIRERGIDHSDTDALVEWMIHHVGHRVHRSGA